MEKNGIATRTLVFGIIALALSECGIFGIIFGAIALSQAKKYAAANDGVLDGKAKVGRILGLIGLIVGIVMTVIWFIYGALFSTVILSMIGQSIQSVN